MDDSKTTTGAAAKCLEEDNYNDTSSGTSSQRSQRSCDTTSQRSQRSCDTNSQRSQRSGLYYSKKLTGSEKRISASESKSTRSKSEKTSTKSFDEEDNDDTKSLSATSKASNTTTSTKLSATSFELKSEIFDGNNSETISFSSEEPKDTEDETTKKNNLGPSDFLAFIGVFFFFYPFVALAIVAYQDLGENGCIQMVIFYVLNACVPAFYWIHYYFVRFPIVIILNHILLWSTATSSLVYLLMGFEVRHITFGAVLGMISSLWHAWLVFGVCGSVSTDDDETDNDDTDNDDDINNNNDRRKSIESLEV